MPFGGWSVKMALPVVFFPITAAVMAVLYRTAFSCLLWWCTAWSSFGVDRVVFLWFPPLF